MTVTRFLAAVRRRRARRAQMGAILLKRYESADWRCKVPRSEIVAFMAQRLGRGDVRDWHFAREVTVWARDLGWRLVRPRGYPHFRGVRRRQAA